LPKKISMKRLANKIAVVYGDGTIGSTIAKAFAYEGARVFLTGRTAATLQAIAEEVSACGGVIEVSLLDALDERAVDTHMKELIEKEGKLDISFNGIGIPQKGIQGLPLTGLSVDSYLLPIATYTRAHFLTAS
jgi:NADP-dependent 3-hydroxy acid dehydrogenase YdfG